MTYLLPSECLIDRLALEGDTKQRFLRECTARALYTTFNQKIPLSCTFLGKCYPFHMPVYSKTLHTRKILLFRPSTRRRPCSHPRAGVVGLCRIAGGLSRYSAPGRISGSVDSGWWWQQGVRFWLSWLACDV